MKQYIKNNWSALITGFVAGITFYNILVIVDNVIIKPSTTNIILNNPCINKHYKCILKYKKQTMESLSKSKQKT